MMGGFLLLKLGHNQEWFLPALQSALLHNDTYFLAWALVGLAYSLLASFIWLRWARPPGRVRRVLGLFFLVALMVSGSQVVARRVMHPLWVKFVNFRWDPDSQEFVVDLASPNAAVAESHIRGDLHAIVSVEGLWWTLSWQKLPQPLPKSEVEEFAVGATELLSQPEGTRVARYSWPDGPPRHVESVRVPWKPTVVGSHFGYVVLMYAALVNREGKRVGVESTYRRAARWRLRDGRIRWYPQDGRMDAFIRKGWIWLLGPARHQAHFWFRPPPPLGVVREDVRVNPRK